MSKSSQWSGQNLNLAPPDYMSSTLTTWPPDCFTLKSGGREGNAQHTFQRALKCKMTAVGVRDL